MNNKFIVSDNKKSLVVDRTSISKYIPSDSKKYNSVAESDTESIAPSVVDSEYTAHGDYEENDEIPVSDIEDDDIIGDIDIDGGNGGNGDEDGDDGYVVDDNADEFSSWIYEEEEKVVEKKDTITFTIVASENRRTSERISKFELSRILGERASALDHGAPPLLDDVTGYNSSYEIAVAELKLKKCVFDILREHGSSGTFEKWSVQDMNIPHAMI